MYPTIFYALKPRISPPSAVAPHDIPRIIFITCNLHAAFFTVWPLFMNYTIRSNFEPFESVISSEYEFYTGFVATFSFFAIILNIFGCNAGNSKSMKALVAYLILTSIFFSFELVFIAFLMRFRDVFIEIVGGNYQKMDETKWKLYPMQRKLECEFIECEDALKEFVSKNLTNLIHICIGILVCQIICTFAGNFFKSRLEKEKELGRDDETGIEVKARIIEQV